MGNNSSKLNRKQRHQLAVSSYIRRINKKCDAVIPTDIIDLIFLFYYLESFLLKAGKLCTINKQQNIVEYKKPSNIYEFKRNTCYGSLEMPSKTSSDIEYRFRLKIKHKTNCIGIGIDDAQCKSINDNYTLPPFGHVPTKFYSYISNGGALYAWDQNGGKPFGIGYKKGDIVTMVYNPYKSLLLFQTNNKKQDKLKNIYGEQGFSYRLAIYMGYEGHQIVELLD